MGRIFLFPSFRNKNMLMIQVNTCSLKIHTSRCWDKLLISVWATITRKAERVPHYHIQNTDQHTCFPPPNKSMFLISLKKSLKLKSCVGSPHFPWSYFGLHLPSFLFKEEHFPLKVIFPFGCVKCQVKIALHGVDSVTSKFVIILLYVQMFTVLGVLTSLLSLQSLKVLYKDRKLLMPHIKDLLYSLTLVRKCHPKHVCQQSSCKWIFRRTRWKFFSHAPTMVKQRSIRRLSQSPSTKAQQCALIPTCFPQFGAFFATKTLHPS